MIDLILGKSCFLRNWPNYSNVSNLGVELFVVYHFILWILQGLWRFFLFFSGIHNLCLLSLSLSDLLRVCQFNWSLLKTNTLFHWFSLMFFCFQFIDFCTYLCYFLSSVLFEFISSLIFTFLWQRLDDFFETFLHLVT